MTRSDQRDLTIDPADGDFLAVAEVACARLAKNNRVRRNLPGEGRLRIDRQLPFLCIYRQPPDREDPGTRELVTTEAAYLAVSGDSEYHAGVSELCHQIRDAMQEHFGTFLFLEIWSSSAEEIADAAAPACAPAFDIVCRDRDARCATVETLRSALSEIRIDGYAAEVAVRTDELLAPPGLAPLEYFAADNTPEPGCVLGIAVKPIFRDLQSGIVFPLVRQSLRWQLGSAMRKAIAAFLGAAKHGKKTNYQTLGPSSLVKATQIVDQQLCDVSDSFDFLLQVTPINADEAWEKFSDSGNQQVPELHYRPLPFYPSLLKRRLFDIEIERIEDPTMAQLFWEKQEEVDRKLTALRDLNTPKFIYSSLQLFGEADEPLVALARDILDFPACDLESPSTQGHISTNRIVARAREEITYYRQQLQSFDATVEVCDQIAAGIMVSRDRLLVSESVQLPPQRVEALLHHEIGTHLLTYFNGKLQPFRQLYAGLAGYNELQEGLAVLAEYLCGGLTRARLRGLAGRVLAVRSVIEGADFKDTYSLLRDDYDFSPRQSFVTTLRAHRGGGLTKDVIYLRGLRKVLDYLAAGRDIEPLYVGKIGLQHLPYVQELRRRGIILPPRLLPRFWDDDDFPDRLEACRERTVLQLMESLG